MTYVEYLDELETAVHSGGPVFVFFFREESAACRNIAKSLKRLTKKHPAVPCYAVDVEKHPTAAGQYLVYQFPTVILFFRSRPVFKRSEELLLPEIDSKLKEAAGFLRQ